jgi:hypothetical protein
MPTDGARSGRCDPPASLPDKEIGNQTVMRQSFCVIP